MPPNNKDTEETVPFRVNGEKIDASRSQSDEEIMCGIGPCKPSFLQCFVRISAFSGVYSISALMTQILSMYIVSQITTIEKQFGFSSTESGFLMSCNDIGFLLTTMMFSYFARKIHIPRTLWVCTVVYGVAGIICSLSYFIAKDLIHEQGLRLTKISSLDSSESFSNNSNSHMFGLTGTPMCLVSYDAKKDTLNETNECDDALDKFEVGKPNKFSRMAMGLIALGMILQGIAKAPRYPFLATYVDDNGKKKNTAMFMGIIAGVGIFGPAIAFSLGGVFSRIYVTLEEVTISPLHPAWIGAWWLGFVIFGVLSIVLAFPLLFFPRRMKPKSAMEKKTTLSKSSDKMGVKDFTKTLKRIVTNPVFMPQAIAECIMLFTVSGMIAFSPKYIETQFFLPAWKVNILIGVLTVVAASAGTVTGGFLVTKMKLSPLQCIKLNVGIITFSVIQSCLGFVFGCPNASLVGYNTDGDISSSNVTCGTSCGCDNSSYFPVCGADNRNYFSPCHAGCTQQSNMIYTNCACVPGMNVSVTPGLCQDNDCSMLYPFLISMSVGAFLGTISMMPGLIIKIRSVSERDKSMAVGFASLLTTLIGWMAGPIIFGMIIDTACVVWNTSCSGKGACSLYDNDVFRVKKHLAMVIPKLITALLYCFVFYKARKKSDWSVDATDNHSTEIDMMISGGDVERTMSPNSWKSDPIYKGKKDSVYEGNDSTG